MIVKNIDIGLVRIPRKHQRIDRNNATLLSSIKSEGMKEAITVVPNGDEYILADGGRRTQVAKKLGFTKVKAIVRRPVANMKAEAYASFLRLTINHHRSDFYPSQRAHYLKILNKKYDVSVADIAKACGVTENSARGWMAVSDCNEEIQMFIDDGKFPVDSGRFLRTLKPRGQLVIAEKFRDRPKITFEELKKAVKKIHTRHPDMIKVSFDRIGRRKVKDHRRELTKYGRNIRTLSIAEMEKQLADIEKEITFMRKEIFRATPFIRKLSNNGKLRLALPGDTMRNFDVFLSEG
jgi:ParB/RepB/Spo0J family partition protein